MMLVDIGNSTIEWAVVRNGKISRSRRLPTSKVNDWLASSPFSGCDRVIVSSVVPQVDRLLKRYPAVHIVDYQNIPLLKLDLNHASQVGSDRIVNALAAFSTFRRSCLVVDSGTATTCCYVDGSGTYRGGIIMPGMGISSQALALFTAKIPIIRVSPRHDLVGKTTRDAVQIGLYRGTIHMINGLIDDFRGVDPKIVVVGTGNGLRPLQSKLNLDVYDPKLILRGLAICADLWDAGS
ncbi:type III pantothenate kinase [bacterium]|nr:type III pantothenate kinase [bacterium]